MPTPVAAPVFGEKSISSIGGKGKNTPQWLFEYIKGELDARADDIFALMVATGFTTKSLSSMLAGAGKDLAAGVNALVKNKDALGAIIKEGTFDAKSLSSMLHGAGKDLAAGIDALVKNKDALGATIKEGTFDAKSLSSMLAGAGKDLAAGIDALVKRPDEGSPTGIEKIKLVLATGIKMPDGKTIKLFNAKSLSSTLHGAGKDLAVGIDAIQSRLPKLKELCTIFRPTQIATRLNPVSATKLGTNIDTMHATYSADINAAQFDIAGLAD